MARRVSLVGIKMAGADVDPNEQGPDVQFKALGGATDRDNSMNLITARQSPGFLPARELFDDAFHQRATHVMLDYTPETVGVRYQVDGVWHDRVAALDRETGDATLDRLQGNLAGAQGRKSTFAAVGHFRRR